MLGSSNSFSVCSHFNSSRYILQDGSKVEGAVVGRSPPSVVQSLLPGLNRHLQLQLVVTTSTLKKLIMTVLHESVHTYYERKSKIQCCN